VARHLKPLSPDADNTGVNMLRPRSIAVADTVRLRRHLALLLAAILITVPVLSSRAEALTADEVTFGSMMNDVRSNHSVRRLRVTERLSKLARRHSNRMAERGELYHSNLRRTFRSFNYRSVGENVGYAGSLGQLLEAFMDSPPHAQNVLGKWRRMGIGVAWKGDRVWVTQLFLT
jgi:uncharacterized protein YkwD